MKDRDLTPEEQARVDAKMVGEQFAPEADRLIRGIFEDKEREGGHSRLWGWFGLSRASFLVLPRVLMHAMDEDWQKRMAILLEEFDNEFPNDGIDGKPYVSMKSVKTNRWMAMPEWVCNYRHPDDEAIEAIRRKK